VVSTPRISIGPAGRWAARRRVRGLVGLSLGTRAGDPCLGATLRTPFKLLFITILNILYVYCSGYASVTGVTAGPFLVFGGFAFLPFSLGPAGDWAPDGSETCGNPDKVLYTHCVQYYIYTCLRLRSSAVVHSSVACDTAHSGRRREGDRRSQDVRI